jgi:hypothetical protein
MLEMDIRPRISGEEQHATSTSWSLNPLLKQFVFTGQEIFEMYTLADESTHYL